jgi:hypothetical protein
VLLKISERLLKSTRTKNRARRRPLWKKAAAGKEIAKEVEKGVAKVLMDKSPAAARATKKPKEAASSPSQPPGAPTKKRKRRSEWGDENVATEPEDCIPINPPIDDEEDDRPPPPLKSVSEVDVDYGWIGHERQFLCSWRTVR